jgi:phage/plasmid-like protein (TIGR03299 family)
MAHMVETMAYAGETPWHGLGVKVPADLSPAQMLEKAGLDWTVEKIPAFAEIGEKKVAVGWSALTRSSDERILGVVSNDWNPVQNHEAFEFFDEYCRAGDMEMHTAGSLRDGQIVWALAKIKDSFELFKGDQVDSYLLFTNPHKFGQCIDVRFTPIRVVCNNTLTLSLNQKADRVVKKNHRTVFDAAQVKEQLGIATEKLAKYKEMAAFLGSKKYKEESVTEYFNRIFPVIAYNKEKGPQRKELSKSATRALEVLHTQPGARFAEGSWWQAFNAVTYLTDHEIGRSADTRLQSAWFGANKNLKIKALETAVEMAEAA